MRERIARMMAGRNGNDQLNRFLLLADVILLLLARSPIPNPQSPIPNPQSPIPNPQ